MVRRVLDGHSTLAVLPTGGLPQQLITSIVTMIITIIIIVVVVVVVVVVIV